MRRLLLALALIAVGAEAQIDPVQYGVAKTIELHLFDADGVPLTGTAASGVTVRCDGGSAGAATNGLSELGTSGVYRLALTSGELACATATVHIASTPAHNFTLTTFGSHDAYDSTGVVRGGLAQDGAATSITLDSGASTDPLDYVGQLVELIDGTGSSPPQTRLITQYSGSTSKIADVNRAWVTNPASGTRFVIHSSEVTELTATDGIVHANVVDIAATGQEDIRSAVGRATANADTQHAALVADVGVVDTAVAQLGARDAASLACTVDAAALTPTTTAVACALTDRDGNPITSASGRLRGNTILFTGGDEQRDKRFIQAGSVWDAGNSVLQITIAPALVAPPANGDTAQIF